jgi:hypothetical protein
VEGVVTAGLARVVINVVDRDLELGLEGEQE